MTLVTSTTTQLTAKQTIQQLAEQHGIVHQQSPLDEWGTAISRLSDSEVELDEMQWLLIELNRAGFLTGQDNAQLHFQYLQERDG
jgi:hypothetical protein